ncbi:hypothetical protein [Burkholderia gladioli]|uniref:hypothetical protein n=1 Tax=Burkholderia gladioli TaxID=28095 RepID=UPI001ABBAAB6|nr:hypothetical protein [Burkholderia gladioli]
MIFFISVYILALLGAGTYAILFIALGKLPNPYIEIHVGIMCTAIGLVGGCLYCLRAIYLNRSVFNQWDNRWSSWYFLRPITSTCCGGISYLFLKAGLLVLESGTKSDASEIGFYALAFIAGLNVDKFIAKIEDVALAVWGIDKTRAQAIKPSTSDSNTPESN